MSVDFKWHVNDARLQKLKREFPQRMDAFGRAVSSEMVGDIKLSMGDSPPDTSKRYVRGVNRVHHPSFPGKPPRVDMGTLRASIRWSRAGKLKWKIHDGVEYGVHLEFGTSRMAARPFMTPVFIKWIHNDFKKMAQAWDWGAG